MKIIRVAAAIIIEKGKVFATQRGYGEFKDGWEFPGGKIEVVELLDKVEYDYPKFHLSMDCFVCRGKSGDLVLKEHEAAKWLTKDELYHVDWLAADLGIVGKIKQYMEK